MKSSILIASYLWRDTWSRWLEQPSSWMARLFVGILLAMVATVILIAFTLLERSLRERLESFGLNTLVVREMVPSTDPELLAHSERPDRLQPLDAHGDKVRLRQLYVRAKSELQGDVPILTYPPDAVPFLAPWLQAGSPIVYLSDTFPRDIRIRVTVDRQSATAPVRPAGVFFRPMGLDSFILAPQGWAASAERMGFIETTLFKRDMEAPRIERFIGAIQRLAELDQRSPPQIQSALPLIRELEALRNRQQQWRALLAGILGMAFALVYGSIAVLEFRQNLYISALLRSLGAPGRFLYLRQWIENGLLANVAAVGAVALVASFHREIFGTLGFSKSVLDLSQANPYWTAEVGMILLWVNVGALLSTLPVAVGLRRPVGATLN